MAAGAMFAEGDEDAAFFTIVDDADQQPGSRASPRWTLRV
jgi:hypothetical protein